MQTESYDDAAKRWLADSGHYLDLPPPGCIFCVCVRESAPGLFGDVAGPRRLGMCLIGRPAARMLPQDCSVGDVSRFVLVEGLPYGTASALLLVAVDVARRRRMKYLIAYHDRTKHTGCIYKKAGFYKNGVSETDGVGWGNRPGRKSAEQERTSKRRWRHDLVAT